MYEAIRQSAPVQCTMIPTPTPGQILLLLYDGAIRFVERAKSEIAAGNIEAKDTAIGRAGAIIFELINALDYSQAPDLCANLEKVYRFMIDQLVEANMTLETEPLVIVQRHLESLRSAWEQVV